METFSFPETCSVLVTTRATYEQSFRLKFRFSNIPIYSKVQKSLPSVFQLFISKEMLNKKIKYIQR